jgi:hypothetical protein
VDGVGVFCVVNLEGVTVGGWERCMIWLVDLGVFIGMRFGLVGYIFRFKGMHRLVWVLRGYRAWVWIALRVL